MFTANKQNSSAGPLQGTRQPRMKSLPHNRTFARLHIPTYFFGNTVTLSNVLP